LKKKCNSLQKENESLKKKENKEKKVFTPEEIEEKRQKREISIKKRDAEKQEIEDLRSLNIELQKKILA
jgi:hypothetical protein